MTNPPTRTTGPRAGRLSLCPLLLLCLATPAAAGPVPEALQPLVPFVEKCEQYEKLAVGWEPVFALRLPDPAKADAKPAGGEDAAQPTGYELVPEVPGRVTPEFREALKVEKDRDRAVLVLDATKLGKARLAFGPPVTGDFRAEFEAKVVSDKLCDLSLVCNGVGAGPGFQFGTEDNKRNLLWPGTAKAADPNNPNPPPPPPARPVAPGVIFFGPGGVNPQQQPGGVAELPKDRLILRRSWHHVRLEVAGGTVAAFVDGRLVGRAPLAPGFDRTEPQRAMLFTDGSKVVIADLRVEQYKANLDKPGLKEAWPKVFGEMTKEQVDGKIMELVRQLNDADAAVRESAERMLGRVGHLAAGPLEKVAGNRAMSPEVRRRAEGLLKTLREQPAAPVAKG